MKALSNAALAAEVGYSSDRKREIAGLFLGILCLLYTLFAEPPPGIKPAAWTTIGVTALMAVWWCFEALPIGVTALVPLVAFPLLGVMRAQDVAPSYTQDLVFLFIGGFAIAYAMETWGLHRRVSLLVLKFCGTNPRILLLGFLVSTGFLSAWMSNTACAALMMPIGLAIVKMVLANQGLGETERKAARNFGICVMLGIAYAASIGGMATLIGTPPNAVMAGQVAKMTNTAVPFANFMVVGAPVSIMMTIATWWLLPVMFPMKALNLSHAGAIVDDELRKLGPMSRGEILTFAVFVFTALFWILRPQILDLLPPVTLGGKTVALSSIVTDSTVSMIALLACFVIPVDFKRGRMLLDSSLVTKGIPWDCILLFGGGFALGAALDRSGVSQYIAAQMSGLAGMNVFLIMGVMAVTAMLISQMTSNTAVAATFVPLSVSVAQGIGAHPLTLAIPVALGASIALSLPVSTPPNAIVFGSGLIRVPDMFKAGMTLNVIAIVITLFSMYFFMPIAFGVKL